MNTVKSLINNQSSLSSKTVKRFDKESILLWLLVKVTYPLSPPSLLHSIQYCLVQCSPFLVGTQAIPYRLLMQA